MIITVIYGIMTIPTAMKDTFIMIIFLLTKIFTKTQILHRAQSAS